MLGFLENIGLSIEGAFVKAKCEVSNHIIDMKLRHTIRKYEKLQSEEDEESEGEEEENIHSSD